MAQYFNINMEYHETRKVRVLRRIREFLRITSSYPWQVEETMSRKITQKAQPKRITGLVLHTAPRVPERGGPHIKAAAGDRDVVSTVCSDVTNRGFENVKRWFRSAPEPQIDMRPKRRRDKEAEIGDRTMMIRANRKCRLTFLPNLYASCRRGKSA